ncbi:MAG: hypothetical protein ABSE67_13860 [Xanthobacteraceae bacterium]|jgi:hypothetical protein
MGAAVPERKIKVPYQNRVVEGTEVAVEESTERWTEVALADGARIRLKSAVIGAVRLDNEYDLEGNPIYVLNATPVMAVVESPEKFKRKKN